MVSDYLKIYLDDTIKLAKTLVIKSDDAVEGINDWVKLVYGDTAVDPLSPGTWKYYQNICGIYHFSDLIDGEYMVIKSLDESDEETGEAREIYFTKENLESHVATRKAYQYGTRYYYSLVKDYPEKEQLILGILYPADMTTAINAQHGTILSYPEHLVEPQESTLIQELNQWLDHFNARWHVKAFGTSDSLYPAAQHAIMYLNLVPKILNMRLRRCKTPEVHSFHIREYLASHGGMDRFLDYMTVKQRLFLYRNLLYIERHAGHKDTFFWLIEKLLTDRYIPLAEYTARINGKFDGNFYPELMFRRKPLNPAINGPERDYFYLDEVLKKELDDAWFNRIYAKHNEKRVDFAFKTSVSAVKQTKLLESSIYDYNNVAVYEHTKIVLNHWAEMSSTGRYSALITYRDPVDGSTKSLNAERAFIYFMYCIMRSMGVTLQTVQDFRTDRTLRSGERTQTELLRVVHKKFTDKAEKAQQLLDDAPVMVNCISVDAFSRLTDNIYKFGKRQWRDVSQTQNYIRRVELQNMYTVFYQDSTTQFKDAGMKYEDWLTEQGLHSTSYVEENYGEVATALFTTTSGRVVDETKLLKNIQKAAISILKQLTSYALQYTHWAFDSQIKLINWPTVRAGDILHTHLIGNTLPLPEFILGDSQSEAVVDGQQSVNVKLRTVTVSEDPVVLPQVRHVVSVKIKSPGAVSSFVMPVIRTGVSVRRNSSTQGAYRTIGYRASPDYTALSDSDKQSLSDAYGTTRVFNTN